MGVNHVTSGKHQLAGVTCVALTKPFIFFRLVIRLGLLAAGGNAFVSAINRPMSEVPGGEFKN